MIVRVCAVLLTAGACLAREHGETERSLLPAQYSFAYQVQDPKTVDLKDHHEEREGEVTRGEYSLVEPDGTKRVVKYTVDGESGFNAVVTREGANVKETYTYGGDAGTAFQHTGSLVHGDGQHQAGHSSLSYDRADLGAQSHHGRHAAHQSADQLLHQNAQANSYALHSNHAGNYAHQSSLSQANNYAHQSNANIYAHQSNANNYAHQSNANIYAHQSNANNYAHQSNANNYAHQSNANIYAHQSNANNYAHQTNANNYAHQSNAQANRYLHQTVSQANQHYAQQANHQSDARAKLLLHQNADRASQYVHQSSQVGGKRNYLSHNTQIVSPVTYRPHEAKSNAATVSYFSKQSSSSSSSQEAQSQGRRVVTFSRTSADGQHNDAVNYANSHQAKSNSQQGLQSQQGRLVFYNHGQSGSVQQAAHQGGQVHRQIVAVLPAPAVIHQIVANDGGQAYYNLNQQNSQKINQGVQNQYQQSQTLNENFRHPDRHDYRGNFGHRAFSQAAYDEIRRQQGYATQTRANAQADLQQVFYDRQDEEAQRSQTVRPGYNPQIHLANQINAYNQQQLSKAYEVKPMMDEKTSKGIVLFYGKEKKFSDQVTEERKQYSTLQKGGFGHYVQFHSDHEQAYNAAHNANYGQRHQYDMNQEQRKIVSAHQGAHYNMHRGAPLYSADSHAASQSSDGYATSYQNFSVKGAKVFVSTKHIVPNPQHH